MPAPTSSRLWSNFCALLPWVFLAACLAISIHYSRVGWNETLLGNWSFRQTQTAITAQYLMKDGFHFAYETPVFGAPWSLPFEFPTYQLAVAAVSKITGYPIDQTGRLVSLLFAYGCFGLLGCLVARLSSSRHAGLYTTALAFVSPVYLFGSRLFMIESTALFFTLGLLLTVHLFLTRPALWPLIGIFVTGALAGPTKATTYAVGLVAVVGIVVLQIRNTWLGLRAHPQRWPLLAGFAFALAVPFALTVAWTRFTDAVKMKNELAAFTTSTALHDWNFGTHAQKLDLLVWDRLLDYVGNLVLGTPLSWFVIVALFALGRPTRSLTMVLLAAPFAGFLVFTNLYYVHDYYLYAVGVYLLAVVGHALGALADRGRAGLLIATLVAAPVLAAGMIWGYKVRLYPAQVPAAQPLLGVAQKISALTPPDSIVYIVGHDWNSAIPYYAGRRALMNRGNVPIEDPSIKRALAHLGQPVGAAVFVGAFKNYIPDVVAQLRGLGLSLERAYFSAEADVYLRPEPDGHWRREFEWVKAGFAQHPYFAHSEQPLGEVGFQGRSAMLVHAPGLVMLERTAAQTHLVATFAMLESSYAPGQEGTDGVTFSIDFENKAGVRTRLLDRRLEPVAHREDRVTQTVRLALPAGQAGFVLLRTETGPQNAWDYSLWRDVRLE